MKSYEYDRVIGAVKAVKDREIKNCQRFIEMNPSHERERRMSSMLIVSALTQVIYSIQEACEGLVEGDE